MVWSIISNVIDDDFFTYASNQDLQPYRHAILGLCQESHCQITKNLYFFIHADKKVQVFVYDLTGQSF